jgi:hypothetical protein
MATDTAQFRAWLAAHGPRLARPLLPHQEEFVAWAAPRRGVINASEQGTGKTAAAWVLLHVWSPHRTLILCPKSLVGEWVAEHRATIAAGWIDCVSIDAAGSADKGAALAALANHPRPVAAVLNCEALRRIPEAVATFAPDAVVFDESWKIKTPGTAVSRAAAAAADGAAHVLALTGTPVGNHVGDLWAQLRFLDPSWQGWDETRTRAAMRFAARYARTVPVPVDRGRRTIQRPVGMLDPGGLMAVIEPYWWRATKGACLTLPPKVHRRAILPAPAWVTNLDRRIQEEGEAALGAVLSLNDERVALIRRRQLAGGLLPVATPIAPDSPAYTWTKEPWGGPKYLWIAQRAADVWDGNPTTRVMLWANERAELDLIAATLRPHMSVFVADGRATPDDLAAAKESFNSRDPDGVRAFICQWEKMAYGHNMQAADEHVRVSHTWSHVQRSQSEDRSHRQGRDEPVVYWDLVMPGTIDADVLEATARKENFAQRASPRIL